MRKRVVKYTEEPIEDIKIINDFLPAPEELVLQHETVKITLSLSKQSVEFFKEIAKKRHTHYQAMIRSLLDQYTEHYRS